MKQKTDTDKLDYALDIAKQMMIKENGIPFLFITFDDVKDKVVPVILGHEGITDKEVQSFAMGVHLAKSTNDSEFKVTHVYQIANINFVVRKRSDTTNLPTDTTSLTSFKDRKEGIIIMSSAIENNKMVSMASRIWVINRDKNEKIIDFEPFDMLNNVEGSKPISNAGMLEKFCEGYGQYKERTIPKDILDSVERLMSAEKVENK